MSTPDSIFEVGHYYKNRKGVYLVEGFEAGAMRVRYQDGTVELIRDLQIQQRIVINVHNERQAAGFTQQRDEDYIIALCDDVLGQTAQRQYRFPFLLGDTGVALPVDAYYPDLAIVVEYRERQHSESVPHWNRMTVSGVDRDTQRSIYDRRREEILPRNGISLVVFSYHEFACDARGRLRRHPADDKAVIRARFADVVEWY